MHPSILHDLTIQYLFCFLIRSVCFSTARFLTGITHAGKLFPWFCQLVLAAPSLAVTANYTEHWGYWGWPIS